MENELHEYDMERNIECIKKRCLEQHFKQYSDVTSVMRGRLEAIREIEPKRIYSVDEVCDLLKSIHDIVYKNT